MLQALRRSEGEMRALLGALRSGVVVHGPDATVLDANPAACRILGLSLDQLRGKVAIDPAWAFLEEDGSPMAVPRFPVNQVLTCGGPVPNLVVGLRRPELPHTTWVLCSAFPLHDAAGALHQVVVTFSEFTKRKQAEDELQRSAARLRQAGRLARLGGWRLDHASGQLWLSPETADVLEADDQHTVTMQTALPLVAPPQRGPLQAALWGDVAFDLELDAHTWRGRPLHLRMLGEPVLDSGGRTVAMQGALQDVTEARREQQQLRLLEAAVARLNDVVLITEADPLDEPGPRIVFVNPAFERLTGWRRDEVLGRSPRMLQSPQTDRAELQRIRSALQRHEAVVAELLNVCRDGQV
jgi:PAS domain-containing protein